MDPIDITKEDITKVIAYLGAIHHELRDLNQNIREVRVEVDNLNYSIKAIDSHVDRINRKI